MIHKDFNIFRLSTL